MRWTRSDTLGLSRAKCSACSGIGLVVKTIKTNSNAKEIHPCACVQRRIFRICLNRYLRIQNDIDNEKVRMTSRSAGTWEYKTIEYSADFVCIAKQVLTRRQYQLFRLHYLLGAEWPACCRQLQTDKGTFFHAAYRIEAKLGRAFRETSPHALFPLDEYFGGMKRGAKGAYTFAVADVPLCSTPAAVAA